MAALPACGGGDGGDSDGGDGAGSDVANAAGALVQPASTRGRLLASNCFQCHATGGVGGFERIRGGEVGEVMDYRSLSRDPRRDIMTAHAQGYTDEQILQIMDYLRQ